jgi:hypothetical protein
LRALAAALEIRPGILADGVAPSEPGTACSRAAIERIARAAVTGALPEDAGEAQVAGALRIIIAPQLAVAGRARPAPGKRAMQDAWLHLGARLSRDEVRSLVQRVVDRLAREQAP